MNNLLNRCLVVTIAAFVFAAGSTAQNLTVREIMAEPSVAGMRPEGEKLSPDGTKVVFLWNAEGKLPRDLYMVSTAGGAPVRILSPSDLPSPQRPPERENKLDYGVTLRDDFARARENQLGNFEWSPDSTKLLFSHGGDIYVMTLETKTIKRYTRTQGPEFGARFIDGDRILFSQSGNGYVLNIADATLTQVTREANPQSSISVGQIVPNKAGTAFAYTVTDSSKLRQLVVPNFLPEYVSGGGPRRGWSEQKVYVSTIDGSRDAGTEIKLPKHEGVSNFRSIKWAAGGKDLIVDRVDRDTKRRQLFYIFGAGTKDEKIVLVTEETDDKWQAPLSSIYEPHPARAGELFFASERDGYNHLYMAKVTAAGTPEVSQITKGNWQVEWAKWSAGGKVVLMSSEQGYTGREFYELDPATGTRSKLSSTDNGLKGSPQMDDTNAQPTVIYELSRWNIPGDVYAQKIGSTQPPVRLTSTVPDRFKAIKWSEPKFLEIGSRDGKKIPAKIYLPAGHDPKKKYPMVVFVHGAGYLQNVINGWNNYYREFMFNDLLTRKGYVVLDIDYRGSAGYGRDWRTDVYDFLGGKDFDDHIDSIDYMVKNYGVDQKRIGTYGGSYGGFMAAMLVTRAPERIAAAAALRPVMDWKNYYAANPGYTAQRLGFPDKNPEAYKRSSPITYADKLERPLLILHGMVDDNVHVQDSVQMIEKLIRLGKTKHFEAMLYPSENHAFVRPESWTDEYERILDFFEKHLK